MAASALAKRWANVSLRAKITGVTVFILTLGLVVAGAGTLTFLRPQLIAQQDATLIQLRTDPTPALAEGADRSALKRSDVIEASETFYVAVLDADGNLLYDNYRGEQQDDGPLVPIIPLDRATELEDTILVLSDNQTSSVWRAVLTPIISADAPSQVSGYMLIASSTETIEGIIFRYLTIFSGFGIAVILLGAALTRILVTNTFEPLNEVERTAAEIADGDFRQRISVLSPNTEVGRLSTSLNTMLDRIDDAFDERARTIEQMRRFVGDASHELRTPLVSVRGYAELYRMGGLQSPEEVAQAMERIEKEAVRMGSLVEDLLALARLDERRPLELAPVNLLPLARDAALDAMAQAPDRTVSVINNGSAERLVSLKPQINGQVTGANGSGLANDENAAADTSANPSTGAIALAGATLARLRSLASRLTPGSSVPITGGGGASSGSGASKKGGPGSGSASTGGASSGSAGLSDSGSGGSGSGGSRGDGSAVDDVELVEVFTDIEPVVLADENKIRQVLTNLLGNALRYTPEGSPIEIVLTPQPAKRSVRIEIVDHGEGIPPQVRSKIFERFWRADTSRNRETGGSGLGLAIVASIVEAHHGRVSAHETPGGGATFRVDLPSATLHDQ